MLAVKVSVVTHSFPQSFSSHSPLKAATFHSLSVALSPRSTYTSISFPSLFRWHFVVFLLSPPFGGISFLFLKHFSPVSVLEPFPSCPRFGGISFPSLFKVPFPSRPTFGGISFPSYFRWHIPAPPSKVPFPSRHPFGSIFFPSVFKMPFLSRTLFSGISFPPQ
ncbi:unnamed protein product [Acanthosepion pharaonis]|uniref:Uncharacterized protein n=1 Tax=Acanthosepion pharaonis TaxID=158019 RepID=A0A812DRQ9_ACAPH|nr:unnamed protein product [Sepia pharaonis]